MNEDQQRALGASITPSSTNPDGDSIHAEDTDQARSEQQIAQGQFHAAEQVRGDHRPGSGLTQEALMHNLLSKESQEAIQYAREAQQQQQHEINYPEALHAHSYAAHVPHHDIGNSYGQGTTYNGASGLSQQSNLMALMQQEVPITVDPGDAQGRQSISPTMEMQHIHNLLPMLLQQSMPSAPPLNHLTSSLQFAATGQHNAEPRSEAGDVRSSSAFHTSGPSFQGTGAFAPLRPQATPATEATFSSGNDGESKLEQRIASSQPGAYQQQAHRAYGWGDQPAAAPGQAHAGAYPPAGQFEQQVPDTDAHVQHLSQQAQLHHQHQSFEQLVEQVAAAAQQRQRQSQGEAHALEARPQGAHKPPQATKSSRFRGVYKRQRGGRWESSIVLDSKNCRLGLHLTEVAAARAYDRVAIKKWGPQEAIDKINFPIVNYNLQALENVTMDELVAFVRSEWRNRESQPIPVGTYTPLEAPREGALHEMEESEESHLAKRPRLDISEPSLNMRNSFANNQETQERVPVPRSSLYRGVSTHKQSGKWVAQIKSGGKQVYLGFYSDQEDAARAYDQAIIHMQGEKAETNFPLDIYAERFDQLRAMDFKDLVAALKQHGRGGVPRVPKLQTEKSIYRGVAPDKSKKWRAQITTSAKTTVYLGLWASEEGAARAYDRANIAKRGDAAKTNFPLSDYTPEIEALQAQSFDSLVADLRAEAVASVATDRANKRIIGSNQLLAPIPAIQVNPESAERSRPYLHHEQASPPTGDSQQRFANQMDAAQFFLNQQQQMQQQMQGLGQPAGFNQNLSAVREYLMASSSHRPDLLYRAMAQREAGSRVEIPTASQAEQWRGSLQ